MRNVIHHIAQEGESPLREPTIEDCISHRCMTHRGFYSLNGKSFGAECAICIVAPFVKLLKAISTEAAQDQLEDPCGAAEREPFVRLAANLVIKANELINALELKGRSASW